MSSISRSASRSGTTTTSTRATARVYNARCNGTFGRRNESESEFTARRGRPRAALPVEAIDAVAGLDSSSAQTLIYILKPSLTVYTLLMIVRIVMTWSPELSGEDFPWSVAFKSTEGLLDPTRKVIKPFNGLDVSPIVWVALLSFVGIELDRRAIAPRPPALTLTRASLVRSFARSLVRQVSEILTGPQGILNLIIRKGL